MEEVTREKNYQFELEAKEARYRAIVDDQTEFITRFKPDGSLTFVNASYARYFGKKPEFLIGEPHIPGLIDEDHELLVHSLESLTPDTPVVTFECRVSSPSNRIYWQVWTIRAFFDGSGKPFEYQGVGRDNTEKRETETRINHYITNLEFLSKKALEFIEVPVDTDIYDLISSGLESIVPGALFTFISHFDKDRGTLTLRSARVRDEKFTSSRVEGRLIGMSILDNEKYHALMASGILVRISLDGLYDAFGKTITEEINKNIGAKSGMGEIYGIGFTREGQLFGTATLFLPNDAQPFDVSLVETYVRQATIALQKRIIEDALLQSEELFSSIAEFSPLAISIIDPDGGYRYINKRFSETFGYSLSDFTTGKEWFRLAFPDQTYRNNVVKAWKEDLVNSRVRVLRPRMYTVVCRDGSKKDVFFRPVTLSDGKQCVVYEDITERRRADHDRQLLSSIIESTGDAVIGKDIDGTVISWNRSAERIYGYTKDEMIGKNILVFIPPDRVRETEEITKKIRQGEPVNNLETTRIRKDGTLMEVSCYCFTNQGRSG